MWQRGEHLFRARNITAPLPASGRLPFPSQGFIDQIESSASSRGNVLNWTLRSPDKRRFQFFAQYTLFGLSGNVQLPWKLTLRTLVALRSGLSFNITTGQDNNGDGVANDRPPGVSRNTGQGPGQISVDVHLGRKLRLRGGDHPIDAEIGMDSFNVLNHENFNNYVGVLTSPLFGRPNSALDGRQMQFTLQVQF